MTLEIKNANAAAQLTEIAGVLLQAAADIEATRTAVNAFINSPDLVSRTYDSIRAQYTNLHMPVLQGMLWYIDEMLADQDAYRSQMTTLKGCHLNEAALLTQLSTAKTLDNIAKQASPC